MGETNGLGKPQDGPLVDVARGIREPLPPELQKTINPFQRFMRSFLGAMVFALIALTIGSTPVIGMPPILYLLQFLGLVPHWPVRRFFDQCTANWMSTMTVSLEVVEGIGRLCLGGVASGVDAVVLFLYLLQFILRVVVGCGIKGVCGGLAVSAGRLFIKILLTHLMGWQRGASGELLVLMLKMYFSY